jgi:uncharacterized damage-inducible protein DinB
MIPSVRAVADRFIFDTANVKYIAANLPPAGLDRVVASTGWTVRQTIGHLARAQQAYATAIDGFVRGIQPDMATLDPDQANARNVAETSATALDDLVALLEASLVQLVDACARINDDLARSTFVRWPLLDVLSASSRHSVVHGLDFADALPELRHDSMVLNWLLYADYSGNAERTERQAKLLVEVREVYTAPAEGG